MSVRLSVNLHCLDAKGCGILPTGKHSIRLLCAFGNQIIYQNSDVGFVTLEYKWSFAFVVKVSIYPCLHSLCCSLFLTCCYVNLTSVEKAFYKFCLEAVGELYRWKIIIFYCIAWTEKFNRFKTFYFS